MKVKKTMFFAMLSCLAIGVTGCDKKTEDEEAKTILTPQLIDANKIEEPENELVAKGQSEICYSISKDIMGNYNGFNVIDSDYRSRGLLVIRNNAGYYGFYSLLYGDFLIAPRINPDELISYNVITSGTNGVGFLLRIKTTNENYLLDALGNDLYSLEYNHNPSYYQGLSVNGTYYLCAYNYNDSEPIDCFRYSEEGVPERVYGIPDEEEPIPEELEELVKPGDLYKEGWEDLSYANLKNAALAKEGGFYAYFENEEIVSTFFVDPANEILGVNNGNAFFQKTTVAGEDATDYTYLDNGTKYYLTQFIVELKTGNRTEFNLGVVFDCAFDQIKSTVNGEYYQVVTYRPILEKRILGDQESHIIDDKFNIFDNVSGLHLGSYVKYSIGGKARYYNKTTKILFDENFKVITFLRDMNPSYKPELNMFLGSKNGKKGLVDLNGIVRMPFDYDSVELDSFYENHVLAKKGIKVYEVNIGESFSENELGKNLSKIGGNETEAPIFSYYNDDADYLSFYSPKEGYLFGTENLNTTSLGTCSFLNAHTVRFMIDHRQTIYTIKYDNFNLIGVDPEIKGNENFTQLNNGATSNTALQVNLSNSSYQFTLRPDLTRVYFEFKVNSVDEEGYYFVSYGSELSYGSYIYGSIDTITESAGNYAIGFNVTVNRSVIVYFNHNNNNNTSATFHLNKGQGATFKSAVNIENLDTSYALASPYVFSTGVNKYYVTFTAPSFGVYLVSSTGVNNLSILNSNGSTTSTVDSANPFVLQSGETLRLSINYNGGYKSRTVTITRENVVTLDYNPNSSNLFTTAITARYMVISYNATQSGNHRIVFTNTTASKIFRNGIKLDTSNGKHVAYCYEGTSYEFVVEFSANLNSSVNYSVAIEYVEPTINTNYTGGSYSWSLSSGTYTTYRTATLAITCPVSGRVEFKYKKYGSSSYGTLYIKNGTTTLYTVTASTSSFSSTQSVQVAGGNTITFQYSCNTYNSSYYASISSLAFYAD